MNNEPATREQPDYYYYYYYSDSAAPDGSCQGSSNLPESGSNSRHFKSNQAELLQNWASTDFPTLAALATTTTTTTTTFQI